MIASIQSFRGSLVVSIKKKSRFGMRRVVNAINPGGVQQGSQG